MNILEAIIGFLTATTTVGLPLYFKYKTTLKEFEQEKEKRIVLEETTMDNELQLAVYDKLLTLKIVGELTKAVDEIFENTKADRFLLLVGLEFQGEVKTVSVIFEQHQDKSNRINAIARYHNIEIDSLYRRMLKEAERYGSVNYNIETMDKSLLKSIYESEGVKHAKIKFLNRKNVLPEKDLIAFSSVSTHLNEPFTEQEKLLIKVQYDSKITPLTRDIFTNDFTQNLGKDLLI